MIAIGMHAMACMCSPRKPSFAHTAQTPLAASQVGICIRLDINVMNHKSDNPHQLRNFLLITLLLGNAVSSMAGSKA